MTKKRGFLDTEEKVRNAQRSLEKATEVDYKKYNEAKRAVNEFGKKLTEELEKYCARTLILSCLQVCKVVKEKALVYVPTYICSMCKGEFEYNWTEEEAVAEKNENFPDVPMKECDIICDVCWNKIKP